MADLIDRQAAISKAHECLFAQEVAAFEEFLELIPTVDAVEVVRCKDCKNYGDEYFCPLRSLADYTDPDDYCSMGERQEDDGCM